MEEKKVVVTHGVKKEAPSELCKQLQSAIATLKVAKMNSILGALAYVNDHADDIKSDEEYKTAGGDKEALCGFQQEIGVYAFFLDIFGKLAEQV